jgi:hypothetical protein
MKAWLWILTAFIGLHAWGEARAANPNSPHPHQGIVEPFLGPPTPATLDAEQLRALAEGKAIRTTLEGDRGARGIAIQDIRASPDTVWNRIAAFSEYPGMVDYVVESEPYLVNENDNENDLRVRFVLKILGFRYEYYIRHDFRPDQGYMTWTLDYTRESDLDDSVGYWLVQAHPQDPGQSRLFYSLDMRTRGWMPGMLRRMIARQGLREATGWVKREAEALQRNRAQTSELNPRE